MVPGWAVNGSRHGSFTFQLRAGFTEIDLWMDSRRRYRLETTCPPKGEPRTRQKSRNLSKSLLDGAPFSRFWPFSTCFGQFRPFLRPDFPIFGIFRGPRDGILARKSRPCTIAHRRMVLKQDVRPHPLYKNHPKNVPKMTPPK